MEKTAQFRDVNYFFLIVIAISLSILVSINHELLTIPIAFIGLYFLTRKNLFLYVTMPCLLILQIYIPKLPGTLFIWIMICLAIYFIYNNKYLVKNNVFIFYSLYIISILCSLLYAIDIEFGVKYVSLVTISLLGIVVGLGFGNRNNNTVDLLLKGLALSSLPLSIVNIVFFMFPQLEIEFLESSFANFLINPGTVIALFNEAKNNILDPVKAGTVFVNTNVASVFFNMLFWVSLSVFMVKRKYIYLIVSFVHIGAMLATNSRAGLFALALSSLIIFSVISSKKKRTTAFFFIGFPIFSIIVMLVLISGDFGNIVDRLTIEDIKNDPRIYLWSSIFQINSNWFLGLGFGRWEVFNNLPAHNILLITWLQSGVIGMLTLTIFMYYVLSSGFTFLKRDKYNVALLGITLTVLLQGMFDNYFLNDYRISALFFMLVGLIIAHNKKNNKDK